MKQKSKKTALVMIGAKIPAEVRQQIEKKAEAEERTVSQIVSRLLSTHPQLQKRSNKENALSK